MKLLLTHSEALELIAHIIQLEVPINMDRVNDSELSELMDKYDSQEACKKLTEKIFFSPAGTRLYNLIRAARLNEPVVLNQADYRRYCSAIGKNFDFGTRIIEYSLSDKIRFLERSRWHLLFYDEKKINGSLTSGINIGILKLGSFSKAEVEIYNFQREEFENYTGSYELYGLGQNHLKVTVKQLPTRENLINLIFFINNGSLDFSIGQYQMLNPMVSGDVIVMNVKNDEEFDPGFLRFDEFEKYAHYKPSIKTFFSGSHRRALKIPNISSKKQFDKWIDRMENQPLENNNNPSSR